MGLKRGLTAPVVAVCVWGVTVAFPVQSHGQGVVLSSGVFVDLTAGDGSAAVRVEYSLTVEDAAGQVTVEVLVPEELDVPDVFTADGERVVLWPASGAMRRATVRLGGGPGHERSLIVEYRVDGAVREERGTVHARVPLLSVSLPPVEGGDVLRASVRVPTSWSVSERFPTGLRPAGEGVYEVSLPVVPSVISLRGRTDGVWRPGLGLILEILTAVILLGVGATAWRNLARVAR